MVGEEFSDDEDLESFDEDEEEIEDEDFDSAGDLDG